MIISELNLTELGLTPVKGIPSAIKPEVGDVWITEDDRLIVVTKVEEPSFGNSISVYARVNGENVESIIQRWPLVLLSMRAVPVAGKVKVSKQ
jgi:hypothetical protein